MLGGVVVAGSGINTAEGGGGVGGTVSHVLLRGHEPVTSRERLTLGSVTGGACVVGTVGGIVAGGGELGSVTSTTGCS